MLATNFLPAWATLVLMLPFGALLALSLFGLDERIAAPRSRQRSRLRFCEMGDDGQPNVIDPGGKAVKIKPVSQRTAGAPGFEHDRPPTQQASAGCCSRPEILSVTSTFQRCLPSCTLLGERLPKK